MSPTLVGRGRELTVNAEFVSDCNTAGESLVLLEESGAGKRDLSFLRPTERPTSTVRRSAQSICSAQPSG